MKTTIQRTHAAVWSGLLVGTHRLEAPYVAVETLIGLLAYTDPNKNWDRFESTAQAAIAISREVDWNKREAYLKKLLESWTQHLE
jgi:hypothetical protein